MKRVLIFALILTVVAACAVYAQYEPRNLFLNGTIFRDVTDGSGFDHQGWGKCIAMGDWDRDGDLDIYVSVVYSYNKLFQNEGNLKFKDMSRVMRVDDIHDTHGIVWADFDNNGYLDLFVANNLEALTQIRGETDQPNSFYLGYDEGFVECAKKAGLMGGPNYSCGVTTADVNGDGLLDIYVSEGGYRSGMDCANSLYVNNGDGTFTDIGVKAGVADRGNGYCCSFCDYDNDGDPDLYVGNINDNPNEPLTRVLYRNNGDGTFTDVTKELGLAAQGTNITCFWGDVDNDGDQDLFLANSAGPVYPDKKWGANSLFRNNGNGTFTDVSHQAGVDIETNSRGCTMGDIDNDGDLDIIVTNSWFDALVLINDGTGKFTESHEKTGGSWFYGHGLALGDLDGDGDLDLVGGNWRRQSASNPGKWFLFENKTNNKNFLKVNLEGTTSNRSAVMSKVWVYDAGRAKDSKALRGFREVIAGSGTFPGNPLQQHFGVDATKKYDVVVKFPSGKEAIEKNVAAGQTIKIVEPK
ncbi:CRTAC1 family protein [bacterium]|nr:CRTAC1 family protein [bacterium]